MNQGKLYNLIILLLLSSSLWSSNFGKVTGIVTDSETGEPLIGANVIIEGTSSGAATNVDGSYVIIRVPPGSYQVRVEMMGYHSMTSESIEIHTNRISYLNFGLTPAVLDLSEVTVTAVRQAIDKDISATTRSISRDEMEITPSTTVTDILQTQPGVINTGSLHFRGGRSGEVVYLVDGVRMSTPLTSTIRSSEVINMDAISEMQVISGTYSAEYGNAMSGVINISTREGGDRLSARYTTKIGYMAGADVSDSTAYENYNRRVHRLTLDGPLPLGKTSFFMSGKSDGRDSYLPWGYSNSDNLFIKLTNRSLRSLKLNLSINLSRGKRKSYSHSWRDIPVQYWYEPNTSSLMTAFGITHSLSSNLYYSLTAFRNSYHYDSGDFSIEEMIAKRDSGYARINGEFYTKNYIGTYQDDDEDTWGLKGHILWQMNSYNEFKAGFDLNRHRIDRFYVGAPYIDDHVFDNYVREPFEASAYLQDKINFSSIILSAGLRFDLFDPNTDYWTDPFAAEDGDSDGLKSADVHSQLSPRLGISYPVSDRTVFHFGYGHYFQRPDYQYIYKTQADSRTQPLYVVNQPNTATVDTTYLLKDYNNDQVVDYIDNMIMNLYSGNGRFGDANLKPEKTITYEFGISHRLLADYLVNFSVYSKKITNLLGARTYYPFDQPGWYETISLHINEDFAYNTGLELQLQKTRGMLTGAVNYTYAVAEGSSSGPLERVGAEEATRQTLKFFPLSFDQRHTFNAHVNLTQGALRGTLLFQYGSGLPYTKAIRGATEPYEINNARLDPTSSIDLKLNYRLQLRTVTVIPYLEIYNLTDHKNVVYVDPSTGKPDYQEGHSYDYAANPENWGAPRIIYLGLEVKY